MHFLGCGHALQAALCVTAIIKGHTSLYLQNPPHAVSLLLLPKALGTAATIQPPFWQQYGIFWKVPLGLWC